MVIDFTNYHLGILWSIGSYNEKENVFTIRHRNKYFLEQLKLYFDNSIYIQKSKTGDQYVFKTRMIDIEQLKELGWTERNSDQRDLPILNDYKDFLRAYIELHSCLDYCVAYRKKPRYDKYYRLRLRIYGNMILIQSINKILNQYVGVGLKKEQKTINDKTYYIAYTSLQEIQAIYSWVIGEPCCKQIWEEIDKKLQNPIRETKYMI